MKLRPRFVGAIPPGEIFAWANSEVLQFFVGFLSFLAFLFLGWRFIETTDPKGVFLLLFVAAFVFFIGQAPKN